MCRVVPVRAMATICCTPVIHGRIPVCMVAGC